MSTVSLRPRLGQVPWITEYVLKVTHGGEEEGMTDIKAHLAFQKLQ